MHSITHKHTEIEFYFQLNERTNVQYRFAFECIWSNKYGFGGGLFNWNDGHSQFNSFNNSKKAPPPLTSRNEFKKYNRIFAVPMIYRQCRRQQNAIGSWKEKTQCKIKKENMLNSSFPFSSNGSKKNVHQIKIKGTMSLWL